jgi:hypothetical protein
MLFQRGTMNDNGITDALSSIESHLARLECTVQEMSNGITRLTWAINLSGSVITVLLGIALVII